MTISMLGDGIYVVALAWQTYEISNAPTALALVGIAWTAPQLAFVLVGGVIGDRFERRRVMILADLVRGVAIAVLGVLSLTGALELWHMFVLVGAFGIGSSLFQPSFRAFVPDVVPPALLLEANALDQFVRPLATRLVGPAIGGSIVAFVGLGEAFLLDAGSFAVSIACLLAMRTSSRPPEGARAPMSLWRDVRAGLSFVRSQRWLAGTFMAVTVAMLFFLGPVYVLMPFVVKNELDAGAQGLGLVFAAGGVGAILASVTLGQRGLPRRPLTVMYLTWALASLGLVGYALAGSLWQVMLVSLVSIAGLTVGEIIWITALQRLVPARLLGRVSSLDGLLSYGLVPLSYALTGPVAATLGAESALLLAGLASGSVLCIALLLLGSVRETERAHPGLRVILGSTESDLERAVPDLQRGPDRAEQPAAAGGPQIARIGAEEDRADRVAEGRQT